jgi:hypothetical protein
MPYQALFLLICHKAYLSAAALIGRRQPDDAGSITRRAIEAACLSLAITHDPANVARWVAREERVARWRARLENLKPSHLADDIAYPRNHPLFTALRARLGYFSDAMVHFTPELVHTQHWAVQASDTSLAIALDVFEPSPQVIDIELLGLIETHLIILDVFDGCFGGAFAKDGSWRDRRADISHRLAELAKPFSADDDASAETDRPSNTDAELGSPNKAVQQSEARDARLGR